MTRSSPVDTVIEMYHLVVAAPRVSPYLTVAFPDGRTPLDTLMLRIERLRAVCALESISLLYREDDETALPDIPAEWTRLAVPREASATAALARLDAHLPTGDAAVIWVALDAPFFDVELTRYLVRLHEQSWCDYTFADGFPTGYAPEVLRRDALAALSSLAASGALEWTRTILFDALSRDINAFDVETEAATEDYALLRLSLTVDTRQNYLLCRRLVERGAADTGESGKEPDPTRERYHDRGIPLLAELMRAPDVGRTLPYYYYVQITTEMVQRPSYTPWSDARWAPDPPGEGTHMDLDTWKAVLARLAEWTPEATIAIGYRGEPALHPAIAECIAEVARYPGLTLYVETAGVGWTADALAALAESPVEAVIVELDAIDETRYRALRGVGYEEALATIERLAVTMPGRVYVQGTRMVENEWELQDFFKRWDATEGVEPLIQKYNSWAGRLPDRKVADFSPLERNACRHLQRDMVILVDGVVPRCFQDLDKEARRGSILREAPDEVWDRAAAEYLDHVGGVLPEMCKRCDEFYTFNA